MSAVLSLADLTSSHNALPSFTPPPRFGLTTFAGYRPQHPSQQVALNRTEQFVAAVTETEGFRWPWQNPAQGKGLYLDGGFGVGKTHLLAAAYSAYTAEPDQKMYTSFAELVHVIGVLGVAEAKTKLGARKLYCIDEFELDDPGNTLIVKTFLGYVFEHGGCVITTSNTPPEAQGQGRFNANDFKREIQSIAERFETVQVVGPDYRKRDHVADLLSRAELMRVEAAEQPAKPKVHATWPELLATLRATHPVRYGALLEQVGVLYVEGVSPIPEQNDALRFVHFVDKLYNLKVGLRLSGVALENLFDPSYRDGAYAKKHYRALSRMSELLEERFTDEPSAALTPQG